jgi:hypothetical protein
LRNDAGVRRFLSVGDGGSGLFMASDVEISGIWGSRLGDIDLVAT